MCVFSWKTTFSKPVYTIFSIRGNIHIMLSHFPTFWRALVDFCRGGKHFGGLCLQYWDNFYFNAVRNRKASYIFWTDGRSNSVCMQSRLSLSISSYPTLSYLSSEHPRPAGPASGDGFGVNQSRSTCLNSLADRIIYDIYTTIEIIPFICHDVHFVPERELYIL